MLEIKHNILQEEWDSFIDISNNGTIFHKQTFLKYHQPGKFNFTYLSFYKDQKLIAVLPGTITNGVFKSPSGSSYGSFATLDLDYGTYEELIKTFIEYCKIQKITEIYLTPPPIIYQQKPNQLEIFILKYFGFKEDVNLVSNAVKIAHRKSDDQIIKSFSAMHQRAVRKSLKMNVKVKQSSDYAAFYNILIENKKKFNTQPTHSLQELLKLKKLLPKNLKLFMAYDNTNNPIAGVLLFLTNRKTILAFYISHYFEYQELRAVNRLFYEIIIWAKKKKYEWFDLGVSMDTFSKNPMEPSRSLIFFKEGINSRGFLRTTYHIKLKQ